MQSDKCNNNHNCPPLRFHADDGSEYSDWSKDTLGNLGTFDKGKTLSKSDISDSGTPMVLYGELYTCYDEIAQNIVRKTQHPLDDIYITKGHEVVIPCSGETAEDISTATCIIPKGVALGSDLIIYNSNLVAGEIISYILNHQQKWNIAKLAQGKSIVHISADSLKKLEIVYPTSSVEQQKIIAFFSAYDEKIAFQKERVEALEERKKGLLQKIFSQEIRFEANGGGHYQNWEEKTLADVFRISTETNGNRYGKQDVMSVSDEYGVVNQIKLQGRSFAGDDISKYKAIKTGQIIYTRSPLAAKPFGIIKRVDKESGIVSPLYIVNDVRENNCSLFWYYYFDMPERTNNYLKPLVRMGAKHTMNISNEEWLSGKVLVPCLAEQQKIADFFTAIDTQISLARKKLKNMQEIKKGLLHQMFC